MHYHLVIGNQAYSSWSLRGWLLLRAFGFEFDHEVVRLYVPEYQDFLDRYRPAATVPTLKVVDGQDAYVIWDSLAIAEFLHEQAPEAGIWPADIQARAAARTLCAEMHSSYLSLRNTMPMNVRREYTSIVADAPAQADIDRIASLWNWALDNWGGQGPYLFGDGFCAADAFYTPVASRFRTYRVPLDERLQRYTDALLEHPATREFYAAGISEPWIMDINEFDCD